VKRTSVFGCVFECDGTEALYAMARAHPDADLLLLDLNMPGAQGYSALVHLRATQPQLPVIVVSAREEPNVMRRALDHGAAGFIPKSSDADTIRDAIVTVLGGGTWSPPAAREAEGVGAEEAAVAQGLRELTPQQFRELTVVATGLRNQQIAFAMGVAEAPG